jgi:hypothetical protein
LTVFLTLRRPRTFVKKALFSVAEEAIEVT